MFCDVLLCFCPQITTATFPLGPRPGGSLHAFCVFLCISLFEPPQEPYGQIPKQPKPSKTKQKQAKTSKTMKTKTGPLKTVKPLLKINENPFFWGPGDGGRFWALAIRGIIDICCKTYKDMF